MHFLQILSVWQNWFAFKPDPIIKHQLELNGTRVKYLDNEKRAYKHEIWSYRISEKASNNAHSGVSRAKLFGVLFNLHTLFMREAKALTRSYVHAGSSELSPHADVIRTIISCADQFIVLTFHCGPFILFSYSVYNLNS